MYSQYIVPSLTDLLLSDATDFSRTDINIQFGGQITKTEASCSGDYDKDNDDENDDNDGNDDNEDDDEEDDDCDADEDSADDLHDGSDDDRDRHGDVAHSLVDNESDAGVVFSHTRKMFPPSSSSSSTIERVVPNAVNTLEAAHEQIAITPVLDEDVEADDDLHHKPQQDPHASKVSPSTVAYPPLTDVAPSTLCFQVHSTLSGPSVSRVASPKEFWGQDSSSWKEKYRKRHLLPHLSVNQAHTVHLARNHTIVGQHATPVFETLSSACSHLRVYGGGKIVVHAGTFEEASNIEIDFPCEIVGVTSRIQPHSSILRIPCLRTESDLVLRNLMIVPHGENAGLNSSSPLFFFLFRTRSISFRK